MSKAILIVDDEKDLLMLAAARLEAAGYQVTIAESGEEGLAAVAAKAPDLVLLDLLLPKMQGDDVCRQLKKDERTKAIPVILFTATACDVADRARRLKADDWIVKPFEPAVLIEKVRHFIG